MSVPKFYELFNPILDALRRSGASASIQEMNDDVAEALALSDADLEELKPNGQPAFAYRMAWARSYLKSYGLLDNSKRGVWSLTPAGATVESVDPAEVKRAVRAVGVSRRRQQAEASDSEDGDQPDEVEAWRDELLGILQNLHPEQFERLCQRVLRESGFTDVDVTARGADGGIDGSGSVRLGGLLSFPILFQCKRYKGSVGSSVVRDFRGAMVGRADRGLILTTGLFTRDARREATRDGAPPVDLVDRDVLIDKLAELRLGVRVETVERPSIKAEWFGAL